MRACLLGLGLLGIAALACAAPGELPSYEAKAVAPPARSGYVLKDGSIQIVAFKDMEGIIDGLDRLFAAAHPGTRFTLRLGNNASALSALTFGASALAPMGAEPTTSGLYGYGKLLGTEPLGIRIAHASLNPAASVSPLGVIVHPSNPLTEVSLGQVTRLFAFGAPKGDFSRWSQLGVKGPLGLREIHAVGLPESDYLPSEDSEFGAFMVLKKLGGLHFRPDYEALGSYAEVVERVRSDPQAVGLVALNHADATVKRVALRVGLDGRPALGSPDELSQGVYPLDRYLYLYVRPVPGAPMDPWVLEYLRLVLSKEGQASIASEAKGYLPLNAREVLEERDKLR